MHPPMEKPLYRSPLRLWLGKQFYTCLRFRLWLFGGLRFPISREERLPHLITSHHTPLLRKLRDVQMVWQYNKITNLSIAAKCLNGLTLQPGETLSYWKAIGRPSKRKGYKEGMILRNGGFGPGIGGGLCQMSNLIYWMSIHTPLTIVERHRHGYDVFPDSGRTQPFGSGATCFYNYGDLMIRNDTPHAYQLCVWLTDEELMGEWRSEVPAQWHYEVYEKDHVIRTELFGGYTRHNVLFRRKTDCTGQMVDDEYVVENHAIMMYTPFLSSGEETQQP